MHLFWAICSLDLGYTHILFHWSPEFFWRDLCFQSRPFVRNAFSPSLMSQIFWNLVYSLSGVKVRECPSLFLIFAKFGPPGPKNGHFWPFFGHFCSFLDLKFFSESEIFLFFNMMFLGIFRSDLQKIVKKGSKFGPPGPKNGHFWPLFCHFRTFSD